MMPPDQGARLLNRMQPLLVSFERVAQLMALELYDEAFALLMEFHKNSLALSRDYRQHMIGEDDYNRAVNDSHVRSLKIAKDLIDLA